MKHNLLLAALMGCTGVALGAMDNTKLPAGVRKVEDIKEAQAEAKQQKKALLVVMSEVKKGGNKLVLEATQQLIQKLRGQCVVVYVNFMSERGKLQKALPKVNEAFDSEDLKKSPIPRAVAMDPTTQKFYALIPYIPEGKLGDEMIKEAKQQIAAGLAGKLTNDDVGIASSKDRQITLPPTGKTQK